MKDTSYFTYHYKLLVKDLFCFAFLTLHDRDLELINIEKGLFVLSMIASNDCLAKKRKK